MAAAAAASQLRGAASASLSGSLSSPSAASSPLCGLPRQQRSRARRVRCTAAASTSSNAAALRTQILAELDGGAHAYDLRGLLPLIEQLPAANPTPAPAEATLGSLGKGVWHVIHAPHLIVPTKQLGIKLEPIRYTYDGTQMVVNVSYDAPVVGKGWLSAAGRVYAKDSATLGTDFTEFWTDKDGALRPTPPAEDQLSTWDKLVRTLGRASFVERWAWFPVLFLAEDLAYFVFAPLNSPVVIRRVSNN